MRRSSEFDKSVKTKKNVEIFMVEDASSTDSLQASSNNSNCFHKIVNETPIVVSDTELSTSNVSEEDIVKIKASKKTDLPATNNCLLSHQKIKEINHWIDGINEQKIHETVKYTELSTIYGDEDGNFQPKTSGNAVSSTFIGSQNKRFDELFKKSVDEVNEENHSLLHIVEDSFEVHDKETSYTSLKSSNRVDGNCRSNEEFFNTSKHILENNEVLTTNVGQETPTCMLRK